MERGWLGQDKCVLSHALVCMAGTLWTDHVDCTVHDAPVVPGFADLLSIMQISQLTRDKDWGCSGVGAA